MFGNQRVHQHPARTGWRKLSIFAGITLVLAGYVCLPKYVLAAFDWPTVARGATDEANVRVTMIQYLLRSKGYSVAVDGRYGNQTQQLVRRFQASHRLKVDGVVGPNTWNKLIVTLKPGSYGDAVRAVQVPLNEVNDLALPINGRFDSRTVCAVKAFQRDNGLPADGTISRTTWLHLTENIYD